MATEAELFTQFLLAINSVSYLLVNVYQAWHSFKYPFPDPRCEDGHQSELSSLPIDLTTNPKVYCRSAGPSEL